MKKNPKIHWGSASGFRVISFDDGTAELQRLNQKESVFECIERGEQIDLVTAHLHWIIFCEGRLLGYREI